MVNFSTVAIIGGLGLLIFFQKDVGNFLNQFKGFGQNFGSVNLPDVNINLPDLPTLPEVPLPDVGGAIRGAGDSIFSAGVSARQAVDQAGIDLQKSINESLAGAQQGLDETIKTAQSNFEGNIKGIQTGLDETGKGISDFFGGIFGQTAPTSVSSQSPQVASRRTGTASRFGGQSAPKEILNPITATTPDQPRNIVASIGGNVTGEKVVITSSPRETESNIIKSEQPDLSLVSPFIKTTQKVESTGFRVNQLRKRGGFR